MPDPVEAIVAAAQAATAGLKDTEALDVLALACAHLEVVQQQIEAEFVTRSHKKNKPRNLKWEGLQL